MANWAIGYVNITGTREGVHSFVDRFYLDGKSYENGEYFRRSRIDMDYSDEIEELFGDSDEEHTLNIQVEFAWSAYCCLIESFHGLELTLSEACAVDRVFVTIHAEESGMGFEEDITCSEDGEVICSSTDYVVYNCPECREGLHFSSTDDLHCYNCGYDGLTAENIVDADDHALLEEEVELSLRESEEWVSEESPDFPESDMPLGYLLGIEDHL